jgi:biotin-dependent carboxylase-like uncharacterized protein
MAVAGAACAVTVDGQSYPACTSLRLRPGQVLTVGPMQAGVYAYLAVGGGFDLPAQLGSLSLHQRAGLGGFRGRPCEPGDRIALGGKEDADRPVLALPPLDLFPDAPIRVVLGPQDDYFSPAGLSTFAESAYAVTQEADRMGYRLSGPQIEHAKGYNIVSDGIVSGSVQVPGCGEPIIMMADRQTTGGYPKIATVISADLRVVAQRRPGDAIRFRAVAMEEAQRVARERAREIAALPERLRPVRSGLPSNEELLALNLAGSAVDALAPEPRG